MKREISILFPILAAAALCVSCTKDDAVPGTGRGVTVLTASVPLPADTKTNIGSKTEGTSATVVWTAGDKLSVLNGASYGTNSEFTLNDGDGGSATGRFSGAAISGDIIAVYPYASSGITYTDGKVTLSIPRTQAYNDTSFAVGSFPMVARGTVGQSLEFKYLFSVIAFKVSGSGKSVDSVTVAATTQLWGPAEISNLDSTPAITMTGTDSKYYTVKLTCATAQDITSDRVFYIAVPAGSYKFAVNVYCSDNTVFHESYYTAKTFTVGNIKYNSTAKAFDNNGANPLYFEGSYVDLGRKAAGYWWAPVNCGYDATNYPYGKLYQWGRKVGGGYNDGSSYTETAQTATAATYDGNGYNKNPEDTKFYYTDSSPYDWYTNIEDNQLSSWPMTDPDGTSGIGNPCPTGWRVPTYAELNALVGNQGSTGIGGAGWDGTNEGYWFNGTTSPESGKGLFLPAAGYRIYNDGYANGRGSYGYYWSSSVNGSGAKRLYFYYYYARMLNSNRAYGYSVRCVQE